MVRGAYPTKIAEQQFLLLNMRLVLLGIGSAAKF